MATTFVASNSASRMADVPRNSLTTAAQNPMEDDRVPYFLPTCVGSATVVVDQRC
jgi:hypothetical protein